MAGWTCCVEQGRYGHYARKPTMLLVYGVAREDLPELDWGESKAKLDPVVVARMGLKRAKRLGEVGARGGGTDSSPRIGTPEMFRDLLIGLARLVTNAGCKNDLHLGYVTNHGSQMNETQNMSQKLGLDRSSGRICDTGDLFRDIAA